MGKSKDLFKEFPPVSRESWEEVIAKDLKGADYNKRLVWNTYEDIPVKPYYRSDDLETLKYLQENIPGEFPYVRGTKVSSNEWEIRQDIYNGDVDEANAMARRALDRGAESIGFLSFRNKSALKGVPLQSKDDLNRLIDGVDISKQPIHFDLEDRSPALMKLYADVAREKGLKSSDLKGSVGYDPMCFKICKTVEERPS